MQTNSTPSKQRRGVDLKDNMEVDVPDAQLRMHRDKLAEAIRGYIEPMEFVSLTKSLRIVDEYESFQKSTSGLFSGLAGAVPTLSGKRLTPTNNAQDLVDLQTSGENALMTYFIALWNRMYAIVEETNRPRNDESAIRMPTWSLNDHQSRALAKSNKKADGVFYYYGNSENGFKAVHAVVEAKINEYNKDLPTDVLGQLADYANDIWKHQPTRTFAPVFLLHGRLLTLFVFARCGCKRVDLGMVCHDSAFPTGIQIDKVATTLRDIWFLLTLSPEKFGQYCDIPKKRAPLCFNKASQGDVFVTSVTMSPSSDIELNNQIAHFQSLRGRLAYLFAIEYGGKRRVLKLSWVPADRVPEGAIYEILHRAKVPHIPTIYDCGIIERDIFGYRLEYLIMDDCNESVLDYAKKHYGREQQGKRPYSRLSEHISQVSSCLAVAQSAGVFHRDISSGNIMIGKDNKARVIDWGYAKVFEHTDVESWMCPRSILARWGTDPELIFDVEAEHDMMTGTERYMSIQVLLGKRSRGLVHDLESLFYVVLHALSQWNMSGRGEKPDGFRCFDSYSLAWSRIAFLMSRTGFYKCFGVAETSADMREILDAMYCLLFTQDDVYIGGDFLHVDGYEHQLSRHHASKLMDEQTVQLLFGDAFSAIRHIPTTGDVASGISVSRRKRARTDSGDQ